MWYLNKPIDVNFLGLNPMKRQVRTLLCNGWERSPNWLKTMWKTFKFAWTLLAINLLNCGMLTPFTFLTFTKDLHIKTWDSTSFDCMSHTSRGKYNLNHNYGMPWLSNLKHAYNGQTSSMFLVSFHLVAFMLQDRLHSIHLLWTF
jgi:hypothetical protein